jgi:hypothetical protein
MIQRAYKSDNYVDIIFGKPIVWILIIKIILFINDNLADLSIMLTLLFII